MRPSSRSAHLDRDFDHRPVDDETKPELPLREASSSLSIDLDLDHELLELLSPEHSHGTSISSLTASPVTNCRSSRPNYTGTFQCHSTSERANFRDRSLDGPGRGQRSTQTPLAAGLSCRSGTGFAGHRPVTTGWRRSPPVNGQPAPVTASRRRSPPANAREAPSCPPNPGFAIYLANFYEKIANFMRKSSKPKKKKMVLFPPHLITADTAGHQPVSGWSLRPVTGHGQPPGGQNN